MDEKISALPAAGALTGVEEVPCVQTGNTVKTTTQDIANLGGGSFYLGVAGGLPAAAANTGVRAVVTDGMAPVFTNAFVNGGGGETVPVYSDGAAWRYDAGGYGATLQTLNSNNGAPVNVALDPQTLNMRVGVTTDGSGLFQVVNIPKFTLDANGVNSEMNGYRVSVTCDVLTNGADIPLVTINGGDPLKAVDASGVELGVFKNTSGSGPANAVTIDFAGATAILKWCDSTWFIDDENASNDAQFQPINIYWNNTFADGSISIQSQSVAGVSGGVSVVVAQANSAAKPADNNIVGANNIGTGDGGDIRLSVGLASGGGNNGNIIITTIPTADPGVPGAIYSLAGVLHISP